MFKEHLVRSMNPGPLSGITVPQWFRLIRQNGLPIEPRYWPRAATISGISVINSVLGSWEHYMYSRHWSQIQLKPPVVVLGAPRSGTTLLHNLLCLDPRFGYTTFLQTRFPRIFLTSEWLVRTLGSWAMTGRRVQDKVQVAWDSPGEDENALCGLTLLSQSLAAAFPHHREAYERFRFSGGFTAEQANCWKKSLVAFLQKVSWRHGQTLVLKSPSHTTRIKMLLEALPEAKFVFIHRNPFDVVRSWIHTSRTIASYRQLQTPKRMNNEDVAARYRTVMDGYLAERQLIPSGRLCEVGFADLEEDPVRTIREIYKTLTLPDFSVVEPSLTAYVHFISGYQKNIHNEMPASLRRRVATECARCFAEWGYPADVSNFPG